MSGGRKNPKETCPLKAIESGGWAVPETRHDDNKDGAAPLLSTQPPSIGFIYPPTSQPSAASNHYDIQPAYNPKFKPVQNGSVDQPIEETDQIKSGNTLEVDDTTPDSSPKDSCPQCCGITIVVLLIIVVLAVVIYFGVKHPQITRAVHSVIAESKKSHEDGKPLAKVLLPTMPGGIRRILNNTLTTTIKPLQNDDDDPWSDDDDLIPVFYT